jgi:hypothetical protein
MGFPGDEFMAFYKMLALASGLAAISIGAAAAAQLASSAGASSSVTSKVTVINGASSPQLGMTATSAQTMTAVTKAALVVAAPTPAPTPTPILSTLKPLNLTDMWLWNWGGRWMASEWGNGNSPLPWKYNHVNQPTAADTYFTLDTNGAPELQALGGTPAYSRGLWETEVTLPKLKDGLIVAPLWVYDPNSRDEVDFEFAGRKGLDVTMHSYPNGVHQQDTTRLFAGQDMSGQRKRFGIKIDESAGYVEMYVDGALIHRWNRSGMPYFISHPVKPWIEMWASNPKNAGFVSWAGKWPGIDTNEVLKMTVHGYGYTALP